MFPRLIHAGLPGSLYSLSRGFARVLRLDIDISSKVCLLYESITTDSLLRITDGIGRKSEWSNADYFNGCRRYSIMGENWTEERDKAVQNTVYYCETCNYIIEPGDLDISIHKKDLPHPKRRRVMILRCSSWGDIVTDYNAQYRLEKTSSGARTASQKLAPNPSTPLSTPFILQTPETCDIARNYSPMNIDLIRKEIPVTSRRAYFDNAGTGPPSINVLNAIHEYLADWRDYGENWEEWLPLIIDSRRLFGKMIGVEPEEVASVPNVSSALTALASSIKYKPNGNIVISELNFPTNIYLWHLQKKHGRANEVRLLRKDQNGVVPLEEWEKAIDDDTSIVSVDYVSWMNGCREKIREIAKIAHEHNAFVIADSFHGLGVFPINAKQDGVDALACGMYKWMQGPHGAAYLYTDRERLSELDPNYIGWHGVEDSVVRRLTKQEDLFGKPFDINDAEPALDATRFEGGSWGVVSIVGAKAALEYALKHDLQERYHRILKVTDRLIDGLKRKDRKILTPLQSERRSGIVVFEDSDPQTTFNKLKSLNIIVASRVKAIRVSPHYYNTEEEIDKLLAAL